jgi:hypothetical protein
MRASLPTDTSTVAVTVTEKGERVRERSRRGTLFPFFFSCSMFSKVSVFYVNLPYIYVKAQCTGI